MTAATEAPAETRKRVSADVPRDVARRLRIWAAVLGKPVAHVIADLICQAVPAAEDLPADAPNGADRDHDDE
jgi:hypothetical protein